MLIIDVNTSSFNNAATSTSPISTATPNGATFLTGNQLQQQQKIIPSPIYTAVSSSPASSTTTTPVSTPSSTTVTSPPVTNVKKRKNSSVRDDKALPPNEGYGIGTVRKGFGDLENDVMYQEAVKIARKILDGLETDLNDRWYEYELPTSLNNLKVKQLNECIKRQTYPPKTSFIKEQNEDEIFGWRD
ncbi:11059_t:CDS:2 [Entrophospora sp. SA101]|nr:11059_t:CDS:2 [Entrophospora sp. SA101]